jgi:outer membrane biosynthesis protein TonB
MERQRGKEIMRSDYGLYGVAIICFIIAVAFAASLVPGYTLADAAGVTVTVVFVLLGIISGVVGYSARPKAIMTPPRPAPTETRASEMPSTPPVAEVSQTSPAPSEPAEPIEQTPAPEPAAEIPEPSPQPTAAAPEPEPMPPAEPVAMEEKPKEKTVRRRRRKATTENTE